MSFMSSKKFAMVPMELINRDDIDPKDKLQMIGVLVALQKFTNKDHQCFPSQKTIGEIYGRSRSWANVGLKKLEELSYMTKASKNKYGTQEYSLKLQHLSSESKITPSGVSIETPHVSRLTQSKTINKNIPSKDLFTSWEISKTTKSKAEELSDANFAKATLTKFRKKINNKYKYTFSTYEEIELEYIKWIQEDYTPKETKSKNKNTNTIKNIDISFSHIKNPKEVVIKKRLLNIVGPSVYLSWFDKTSVNFSRKTLIGSNDFHTNYLNQKYDMEISQVFLE